MKKILFILVLFFISNVSFGNDEIIKQKLNCSFVEYDSKLSSDDIKKIEELTLETVDKLGIEVPYIRKVIFSNEKRSFYYVERNDVSISKPYSDEFFSYGLVHEIGHVVDCRTGATDTEFWKGIRKYISPFVISEYARTNDKEFFAELFVYYFWKHGYVPKEVAIFLNDLVVKK